MARPAATRFLTARHIGLLTGLCALIASLLFAGTAQAASGKGCVANHAGESKVLSSNTAIQNCYSYTAIQINNTADTITVPWGEGEDQTHASVLMGQPGGGYNFSATNSSWQTYDLTSASGADLQPTDVLVTGDVLHVTASNGSAAAYEVVVAPSPNAEIAFTKFGSYGECGTGVTGFPEAEHTVIHVNWGTTPAVVKQSLRAQDQSTQTYAFLTSSGETVAEDEPIAKSDVLVVTSENGDTTRQFQFTVNGFAWDNTNTCNTEIHFAQLGAASGVLAFSNAQQTITIEPGTGIAAVAAYIGSRTGNEQEYNFLNTSGSIVATENGAAASRYTIVTGDSLQIIAFDKQHSAIYKFIIAPTLAEKVAAREAENAHTTETPQEPAPAVTPSARPKAAPTGPSTKKPKIAKKTHPLKKAKGGKKTRRH